MNVIEKAKKIYNVIVGDTQEKKLDIILNHLIDSIELKGDMVHIKTKKNIAIENEGHTVIINSGMQVLIAKEIQLNPKIDFSDAKFSELEPRLEEAERKEAEELAKFLANPHNH